MPCKNHPDVEEGLAWCSRCGEEFCRDCVVELGGGLYCAGCKGEQVKDIVSGADAALLDLASIGRRFVAILIDGLVLGACYLVLFLVLMAVLFTATATPWGGRQMAIAFQMAVMLVGAVVSVVYEGLMLQHGGQTVGKMALSIKVVTPQGGEISPGQAWGRALVRVLFNVLSYLSIIDYLPAFFSTDKKCIHDMAAGTRVVNWRP